MDTALKDLKLTKDEVKRLNKAFKDPEFCKLFAEYAEEIRSPENRKKYEEEIKIAEQSRGVDVQFINPNPHFVLKSFNWPSLCEQPSVAEHFKDAPPLFDGQKVFINICSSDRIAKPEVIHSGDSSGDSESKKPHWSIPHSFSPPQEELDKSNNHCITFDVVFHPEAIKIGDSSAICRHLIESTAIEGIHAHFKLCLGLTKEQAQTTWCTNARGDQRMQLRALKCVRILKGVTHKGPLKATIIRRKRADFYECEKINKESEQVAFDAARNGPHPKESLAALAKLKVSSQGPLATSLFPSTTNAIESVMESKYKVPEYRIVHSDDFDMLDYCLSGSLAKKRPKQLNVEIILPDIYSAACLDLDVTCERLHLQSEKPVAYKLDVHLPFPVDNDMGKAKFSKPESKLFLTLPVIPMNELFQKEPITEDFKQLTREVSLIPELKTTQKSLTEVVSRHSEGSFTTVPVKTSDQSRRRRKRKKNKGQQNTVIHTCKLIGGDEGKTERETENLLVEANQTQSLINTTLIEELADKSDADAFSMCFVSHDCIPTSHVLTLEKALNSTLYVPKPDSFASVRFRQDARTFTALLAVGNVLPSSLKLFWSPCDSEVNVGSSCPLRLLIRFTSRGGGGCALNWGVVFHCPSEGAPTDSPDKDCPTEEPLLDGSSRLSIPKDVAKPQIISCDVTANNVSIIFRKPMLSNSCHSSWWDAVAVGRSMGPGLQKIPIIGLFSTELASSTNSPRDKRTPDINEIVATQSSLQTFFGTNSVDLHFLTNTPCAHAEIFPNSIQVTQLATSKSTLFGMDALQMNRDWPTINGTLKGILKQRSTSESSLDDFQQHFGTSATGGCLGGELFSSSEFQTASSNENISLFRRSGTDSISSPSGIRLMSPDDPAVVNAIQTSICVPRRRLRSVNFSSKDEKVAFSPFDTVETLHHLLKQKQKNARRSERRRRHNSYTAPSTPSEFILPSKASHNPKSCDLLPSFLNRKERRKSLRNQKLQRPTLQEQRASPEPQRGENSGSVSICRMSTKPGKSPMVDGTTHTSTMINETNTTAERVQLWTELPSAKTVMTTVNKTYSHAPATSQGQAITNNPHITSCPIPLTANAIFDLEDDFDKN